MHNDPQSWQGWLELFQSWWRGDTPLGAVLMSLFMAGLRIAYFGGNGGWKKKTLEILLCGALTLTFSSALEYFGWPKSLSVAIGGGVGLNLSPAKVAIAALVAGAMLIIENWDDVAPVIKAVWQEVDNVAQAMGGWETVIEGVGLVMAGSFTVRTIGALQQSVLLAGQLSGLLGKIGRMGAMTLTIGVAVSLFKELKDLEQGAKDAGMDAGAFAVQKLQTKERERGYNGFIPRLKEILGMDTPIPQGRYQPYVPLTRRSGVLERAVPPSTQRSELKVTFENAPQGMRVTDIPKSGNPLMNISHDVGYSPFRTSR